MAEYYNTNSSHYPRHSAHTTSATTTPSEGYSYTAMVMAASTSGSEHGSFYGEQGSFYGSDYASHQHSSAFYGNGAFNSGVFYGGSEPSSPACAPAQPQVPVKRWTHDPYASAPSTPTSAPVTPATSNFNTSNDSTASSTQLPPAMTTTSTNYAPVYAPEGSYNDSVAYPVVHSTAEQFNTIVGSISQTACTPKGRHLLLSVMRLQHTDKIQIIFQECLPNIAELAINQNGCHVLRTLIENLSEVQLAELVNNLTPDLVIELATNSQFTRRIIQSMFEKHKSECLNFIVEVISQNCATISCTQQGCIAVMRILEHGLPRQQHDLLDSLTERCDLGFLAKDAYGNYVVQSIISNIHPTSVTSDRIGRACRNQWVSLAKDKFASNVLEKLLRIATFETRSSILGSVVFDKSGLEAIMGDGYGNFVLQAIIENCTDAAEFREIAERVRALLPNCPYGHKIEAKLKAKRMFA